jgi:hypothetical protein
MTRYLGQMLRIVMLVAALAATAVLAAEAGTSKVVRGIVLRSPTMPVCIEGKPCSAPAPSVTIVFARDGSDVSRATTDASGRFVVRLVPGTYGVRVRGRGPLAKLSPRLIRVRADEPTALRLLLDTGIRGPGPWRGGPVGPGQ